MQSHGGSTDLINMPGMAGTWEEAIGDEDKLGLAPVYTHKGPRVTKMLALDPGNKKGKEMFKLRSIVNKQMHFWRDRMVRGRRYGGSSGRDDMSLN